MVATETVGPFDGTPWAQDQWFRYAAAWAPSGVLDVPASSASAGSLGLTFSGLTPTLAAGRAWARGGGYELAGGSKTLPAVAANTNASLQRRDRIVLRRDLAAKTIALVQLQGTPAASPAAPALQQNETGQWDSPLFSFLVPPNSGTSISGIIDERQWLGTSGRLVSSQQTGYWGTTTLAGANGITTDAITADLHGVPYRLRASASIETMVVGSGVPALQLFIDGVLKDRFKIRGVTPTSDLFPAKVMRTVDITDGRPVAVYARLDIPGGATATTYTDDTHSWLTVEAIPLA